MSTFDEAKERERFEVLWNLGIRTYAEDASPRIAALTVWFAAKRESHADMEALRQDADRYRWLLRTASGEFARKLFTNTSMTKIQETIDAAMKEVG